MIMMTNKEHYSSSLEQFDFRRCICTFFISFLFLYCI